jgi:autotransporter passenger strand-loop-strand repeat protein
LATFADRASFIFGAAALPAAQSSAVTASSSFISTDAYGTVVSSGGLVLVSSGGTAIAASIIGGKLEVRGGSTGSSAVTFATSAGGILQLTAR